jgi:hypothetical protein
MDDAVLAVRAVARLARLLERCCDELSLSQYRVLTVTAAVDALVERLYLRRGPVPVDRRAARITVTPAGRRALRAAEAGMAERLEAVLARVDDREWVVSALAAMDRALDDVVAPSAAERRR